MAEADYMDLEHTGPGTLAGRYLRTFWQPVFRSKDLRPGRVSPIQILGEKLTLFRGEGGEPHLVGFRCAHRGSQLSVGWVEGDAIHCRYHGWAYDGSGRCVEQPGEEDEAFRDRVGIQSYPCQEYLGLIFAYLGEGSPPPLRRFVDFERPGVLEAGVPEIWPCNYFNRIDNDSAHVPFTHRESTLRTSGRLPSGARDSTGQETEYGVMSTSLQPGRPQFYVHFHMPNTNQTRSVVRVEGSIEDARNLYVDRLFWRLPIDDDNCISYVVDLVPLTGEAGEAYRERRRQSEEAEGPSPNELAAAILRGELRVEDVDPSISMYKLFWIEDYMTQVGQGSMAERPPEHLARSDQTVILKRKVWQRELKALSEGRPLKQWTEPPGLADMNATTAG
ncbi:MAG: Rieske 2Fe-2S protein [Chloroflexi bacterium]|nr:Rieske 2Fe-2S protein [Chloroflexota bacterium]